MDLRHPLFAWLGLRTASAQHTPREAAALRQWARSRRSLVEIGVAEGASALTLREVMHPQGTLYLVDPFHLSRIPALNFTKRVARRTVHRSANGRVCWVRRFSADAARDWNVPIDFLFVDGDHSSAAVRHDWWVWHPHVGSGGVVAFHDARTFEGGWTRPTDGPVALVRELFVQRAAPDWEIVAEVDSLVVVRRMGVAPE